MPQQRPWTTCTALRRPSHLFRYLEIEINPFLGSVDEPPCVKPTISTPRLLPDPAKRVTVDSLLSEPGVICLISHSLVGDTRIVQGNYIGHHLRRFALTTPFVEARISPILPLHRYIQGLTRNLRKCSLKRISYLSPTYQGASPRYQ